MRQNWLIYVVTKIVTRSELPIVYTKRLMWEQRVQNAIKGNVRRKKKVCGKINYSSCSKKSCPFY